MAKEYLENFGRNYDIEFTFENRKLGPYTHPGRSADVLFKNEVIGEIFEVHPLVLENLDMKKRAWIVEIDFEKIAQNAQGFTKKFQEDESSTIFKDFSRFEVSKRDIAVVVDKNIDGEKMSSEILGIDDKIISAELFDEYISDALGEGKKSLAFHLVFQADNHTLNDKEVEEIFNKILNNLSAQYGAKLRG